jgi:hypothetical protein
MTGKARVTDITAESDGLTETVSDSHILLIMVRLQSGGLPKE